MYVCLFDERFQFEIIPHLFLRDILFCTFSNLSIQKGIFQGRGMLAPVTDADTFGKRVLVRVDYNVPIANGIIQDDTRIQASLPTINYLLDQDATIILCAHLGRPGGKVVPELSLEPVALHLADLLEEPVEFVDNIGEPSMKKIIDSKANETQIFLLENTRFHPGEKSNDREFSKFLASLADIFVSDAFGAVHRAHASTRGVTRFIPGYAGKLVLKEYERITAVMENPQSPALAIFGGAKISTKIGVLENFIGKADVIALGGGMANTFLKAQGKSIGNSLYEEEMLDTARTIMDKIKEAGLKLVIPIDVRLAQNFDEPLLEDNVAKVTSTDEIPDNTMILDIGPKTEIAIVEEILKAKTITWNGPLGVFEKELYRIGTINIAKEVVKRATQTVIGGGETAYAMNMLDTPIPEVIHISTGGGASLELMSGEELPGLTCLTGQILEEQ